MKNFVQDGDIVSLTAPYDVASGAAAKVGGIIGIAVNTVASGAVGQFKTKGVFDVAKVSAQAWATVGLDIYWDDTAKKFTTVSTDNTLIGKNVATAANPSATGRLRLNG